MLQTVAPSRRSLQQAQTHIFVRSSASGTPQEWEDLVHFRGASVSSRISERTPDTMRLPLITARPSQEEKALFASVAAARGMTESALALNAIRAYLGREHSLAVVFPNRRIRATDRVTIRLRPGDGEWIGRRAAERGMKNCAYLAALVRAHVAHNPPLPTEEIRILKRAVAVLVDLGRIVNSKSATTLTCDDLQHTRAAVLHVEKQLRSFAKAALMAWESRVD